MASILNHSHSFNIEAGPNDSASDDSNGFFNVYFSTPRFATETALAITSTVVNFVVLACIHQTKTHRTGTVYNALFVNLVMANICTCILAWFCNNSIMLFELPLLRLILIQNRPCTAFVYLMAAVFLQAAAGIVVTLTMLGFATVQYLAICKPLEHLHMVSKSRLICFIAVSWAVSLLCGIVPSIVLYIISERLECDDDLLNHILNIAGVGNKVSVVIVGSIFLVIVVLCCRIYIEVKRLQRRLSRFRFDQDVNYEKKAFITTVILLATLTFFFLPYITAYLISYNPGTGKDTALIYYMTLLPYFKFLSDPLIYGARMREVREACFRLSVQCGFKGCVCLVRDIRAPSTVPLGTCSIQLRHIPSYPPAPL
ncbi:hypothetical protein CAPTEDRAFT_186654 [Capitella teleta]|uniref:G-protein coupled receptors family 1 profile domain-containing protein n=1 Tax=Capitella teleta TaxID=283909 RepID=R7TWX5_CAPTE|nr:hypothetical protein CAPTEDRAFT_186654 [Capitella teleta]|eukprot:ELT95936.1 hypothetical protein CAPTEDRAFT_186654 [Capitella teleta]